MSKKKYLFLYGSVKAAKDAYNAFSLFQSYSGSNFRKIETDNTIIYFDVLDDVYRFAGMYFHDIIRFTYVPSKDWEYLQSRIRWMKE